MAKNNFQYGGWNYYTLQCGTIMTLISPGFCTLQYAARGSGIMTVNSPSGSTLQCDTALALWHWIRQVAAPCNVAGGSGMTSHRIRANVRHIGILHLVSILTISPHVAAVDMSFCTSVRNFIQIGPPSAEKKSRHVDFQDGGFQPSWILVSNNGFSEKPMYEVANGDHSSKLYLVFEKIAFLQFWRQGPRWRISKADRPNSV